MCRLKLSQQRPGASGWNSPKFARLIRLWHHAAHPPAKTKSTNATPANRRNPNQTGSGRQAQAKVDRPLGRKTAKNSPFLASKEPVIRRPPALKWFQGKLTTLVNTQP